MLRLTDILSAVSILVLAAIAILTYPHLPDPMPVRWNFVGDVVGHSERIRAVTTIVAMPALVFLVFVIIAAASPSKLKTNSIRPAIGVIRTVFTISTAAVSAVIILSATSRSISTPYVVSLVLAAALIVFGNYCPKLRQNLVAGIRVPWTLASEEVWNRTHRVTGWLFVLAGVVTIFLERIVGRPPLVLISALLVAALLSTIYSFWLYIKLGRPNDQQT